MVSELKKAARLKTTRQHGTQEAAHMNNNCSIDSNTTITMEFSSRLHGDEDFPEEHDIGLGFSGGPEWHYPEEEVEFVPFDESEDQQHALEEDEDLHSCSSDSVENYRLAIIEKYIGTHDIIDDGEHEILHDLLHDFDADMDYALSEPPPTDPGIVKSEKLIVTPTNDIDDIDDDNQYNARASPIDSDEVSPLTSPLVPEEKGHTRTSKSLTTRRKRRRDKDSVRGDTTSHNKEQLRHFREAALCVPFEYTTKNATYYIRRPHGIVTVPEVFRQLGPHTSDEEYERRSRVSSSQTIQVAISVSADDSLMLLYGSAGVRYKTDPSNPHCDDWVDVPDVGAMDVPLGYVNNENCNSGNHTVIEYSLDEILEEAMFVREQYCTTVLSAALEVQQQRQRESLVTAEAPSPPSLAKSIVSTPPRSSYYYDGSSDNSKSEEDHQQDELKGRKLDFLQCISPSLITRESSETTSTQPLHSSRQKRQKKLKRRLLLRFCQRILILLGFYICGIFLVANISGVDQNRPGNNLVSWMFLDTVETQDAPIKAVFGNEKPSREVVAKDGDSFRLFQIAALFTASTTNERIESDYYASIERLAEERNSYQRELENTQKLLQEQVDQNNRLSQLYNEERIKAEELQKEKDKAMELVEKLRIQTEALTADLETAAGQRHKLEETLRQMEIQVMTLKKENSQMKPQSASSRALDSSVKESFEETPEAMSDENSSLEEEGPSDSTEESNATDESFLPFQRNEMQSFESVLLKSARSKNKGPLLPKLYKRFSSKFGTKEEIEDKLKSSADKVIQHGKEGTEELRRQVIKNVDEASTVGIKKLDRGQKAINSIGDFAKSKLQSVGRQVKGIGTKHGRRRKRSQRY